MGGVRTRVVGGRAVEGYTVDGCDDGKTYEMVGDGKRAGYDVHVCVSNMAYNVGSIARQLSASAKSTFGEPCARYDAERLRLDLDWHDD